MSQAPGQLDLVDLHAHVLPGVDDGPPTVEDSVALLAAAYQGGTRAIAATPHMFSPWWPNDDVLAIHDAYARLIAYLARETERDKSSFLGEIRVHLGAEHYVSDELLRALSTGRVLPLGEGRHLLVEMPPELPLRAVLGAIDQVLDAGFVPLVAHVERLEAVRRDPRVAAALLERGAFLQVNAQSLAGWPLDPLRRTSQALLAANLVTVVASDAHDCVRRPPSLEETWRLLSRKFSPADATRWLRANPASILQSGAEGAAR